MLIERQKLGLDRNHPGSGKEADDLESKVAEDPELAAFKGGARLAASPQYSNLAWSKHEYEEQGSARLHNHPAPKLQQSDGNSIPS